MFVHGNSIRAYAARSLPQALKDFWLQGEYVEYI